MTDDLWLPRDGLTTSVQLAGRLSQLNDEIEAAALLLEQSLQNGYAPGGNSVWRMLALGSETLVAAYSAGEPIVETVNRLDPLAARWPSVWTQVEDQLDDPRWQRSVGSFATKPALEIAAAILLSWAAVAGRSDVVRTVISASLVQQANDPVIGHLARFAGVDAPIDGSVGEPRNARFRQLWLDVAEAAEDERRQEFVRYLRNWPKAHGKVVPSVAPGTPLYSGSWAFDAAALAVWLDVDDAAVRDLPGYPAALVEYGRSIR